MEYTSELLKMDIKYICEQLLNTSYTFVNANYDSFNPSRDKLPVLLVFTSSSDVVPIQDNKGNIIKYDVFKVELVIAAIPPKIDKDFNNQNVIIDNQLEVNRTDIKRIYYHLTEGVKPSVEYANPLNQKRQYLEHNKGNIKIDVRFGIEQKKDVLLSFKKSPLQNLNTINASFSVKVRCKPLDCIDC